MAVIHGIPGEWARVKGTISGLWILFAGIAAGGFSIGIAVFCNPLAGAALFALSAFAALFGVLAGAKRIERNFKGARGEERVSRILGELPPSYHVYNDFNTGSRRVDHVVVGPAGVFSVETKNWHGEITIEEGHILVDGSLPTRLPLPQAKVEAKAVADALAKLGWKGDVTPVLAFASDAFKAHIAEIDGTVVMNACELKKRFSEGKAVLASTELERLNGLMENYL